LDCGFFEESREHIRAEIKMDSGLTRHGSVEKRRNDGSKTLQALAERTRDVHSERGKREALARDFSRGLRRAGHGWPAAASQSWVSNDRSRGTAAQSLGTPGALRRAGGAPHRGAC